MIMDRGRRQTRGPDLRCRTDITRDERSLLLTVVSSVTSTAYGSELCHVMVTVKLTLSW